MVRQRDIVEVHFDEIGIHPVIVLSNNLIHEVENAFICVMMTSKQYDDEFSFPILDNMLVKPLNKDYSEVRCHLIQFFYIDDIVINNNNNQIKIKPFNKLLKKINKTTFSDKEL